MKKIKTLGIFDSGLGGYTIYHDLCNHIPAGSFVLFADQAHAPYGNQSNSAICEHASNAMAWFKQKGIYDVLIACNTVSAVALSTLVNRYPEMTFYGIIDLTVAQLTVRNTAHIGVVATQATINAGAYNNALQSLGWENITSHALPDLVNLIEDLAAAREIDAYLERALKPFQNVDTLVLGCTHYPLVMSRMRTYFGGEIVTSIEPIRKLINETYQWKTSSVNLVYTSGNTDILEYQIQRLFNVKEKVRSV